MGVQFGTGECSGLWYVIDSYKCKANRCIDMTEQATIKAERQDKHKEHGNNPVNPIIVNPMGKLPTGAWEKVTNLVQSKYSVEDFAFNGQEIEAGYIEYEPTKDGDIVEIYLQ